ncbi:hypothetical protein MTO96_023957 [Rhipicephalus appendiculatus]
MNYGTPRTHKSVGCRLQETAPMAQQPQVCPAPKRLERGNLKSTEKFLSSSSIRRSQRLQSTAGPPSGRLKRHDGFSVTSKDSISHERVRKGERPQPQLADLENFFRLLTKTDPSSDVHP